MTEYNRPIDRIVRKGIDSLNRHGAYSSTEGIRKTNWQFKTGLLERFENLLPKNPIGVDVGAADGMMSAIMKEYNSIALDTIPQKKEDNGIPFVKASAESLPFPNNSLDYVTILYSLHHLIEPKKAFTECVRVLKRGGLMVVLEEFPRYPGQEYFLRINEASVNNVIFGDWDSKEIEKYTSVTNYFKKNEFENLATACNLKTVDYKRYPRSQKWDIFFKSSKNFYVFKKV